LSGKPGLASIFLAFARISVLSVGGATMAWIRDLTVKRNQWLSEEEFAEALAVCQLLPGANTLNMAVFLGSHMRGPAGALAAVLGLTTLPFALVLALGVAYGRIEQGPRLAGVFQGLGAGAAGVALGTALQMAQKHLRQRRLTLVATLVFVLLAVMRLPMGMVVPLVLAVSFLLRPKKP
jgi:chromate transporter